MVAPAHGVRLPCPRDHRPTIRSCPSASARSASLHAGPIEAVFAPRWRGTRDRCPHRVGRSEIGANPGPVGWRDRPDSNRVSAGQIWCGRTRIRTWVGASRRSPPIPTRPRPPPVTCANALATASAVTGRLRPCRPVPRGQASRGGKVGPPSDQNSLELLRRGSARPMRRPERRPRGGSGCVDLAVEGQRLLQLGIGFGRVAGGEQPLGRLQAGERLVRQQADLGVQLGASSKWPAAMAAAACNHGSVRCRRRGAQAARARDLVAGRGPLHEPSRWPRPTSGPSMATENPRR